MRTGWLVQLRQSEVFFFFESMPTSDNQSYLLIKSEDVNTTAIKVVGKCFIHGSQTDVVITFAPSFFQQFSFS